MRSLQARAHLKAPAVLRLALPTDRNLATRDPRIRRALELLQETHEVRFGQIASNLNLSGSRFRHLFKKELGMSPRHYARLVQLEKAKDLLKNSFLTVKEVAALVGVNDMSHFSRDYKVQYRQTPSQTRMSLGVRRLVRIAGTANK